MRKVTLSYSTAVCGLIVLLVLIAANGWLTYLVHQYKVSLDSFTSHESSSTSSAAMGEALPSLVGKRLTTGEDFSVVPISTKAMAVLVYRESCPYCEKNWENWEKLFGDSSDSMPAVFISGDKVVSAAYRQKHSLLEKRLSMIGIDPDVLSSLHLDATPQTLLVVKGKVVRDWVGVLTDDRVREIKDALATEVVDKA